MLHPLTPSSAKLLPMWTKTVGRNSDDTGLVFLLADLKGSHFWEPNTGNNFNKVLRVSRPWQWPELPEGAGERQCMVDVSCLELSTNFWNLQNGQTWKVKLRLVQPCKSEFQRTRNTPWQGVWKRLSPGSLLTLKPTDAQASCTEQYSTYMELVHIPHASNNMV